MEKGKKSKKNNQKKENNLTKIRLYHMFSKIYDFTHIIFIIYTYNKNTANENPRSIFTESINQKG